MVSLKSKHRLVTLIMVLAMLAFFTLSGAGAALADSGTASSAITGGTLTETMAAPTMQAATLNGTDTSLTLTMPITVDDATGSGTGWNVTITSTQFTTGGGTPHTLATTAASVSAIAAACAAGSTCTLPTNAITYPLTIPAAATAPTAVKLYNAAANTGMGKVTLTPTIAVSLPANSYAGTYSSTITMAIVSGP